jgi:hypothetical protein
MNTRGFLLASLVGGLAMSLFSNIPILNLANCFICLWLWTGGIFAVFLYRKFAKDAAPLTPSQGLLIGLLAGVVGAIISTIISSFAAPNFQAQAMRLLENNALLGNSVKTYTDLIPTAAGFSFISLVCNLILYPLFGLVGGLIGAALFKNAK